MSIVMMKAEIRYTHIHLTCEHIYILSSSKRVMMMTMMQKNGKDMKHCMMTWINKYVVICLLFYA